MKRTKRYAALLLALVMTLLLGGCGKEETFTVRVGLLGENQLVEPAMVSNDSERTVVSHLYENLMKIVPDGENGIQVQPGQAKSYTCDDEVDGTQTYTFHLRDDITWSDGQAVTAEDFVRSWRHLADPETKSPNAAMLNVVQGYDKARSKGDMSLLQVEAEDEQTLVVKLNCRCAYFLSAICTAAETMPARTDDLAVSNGAFCMTALEDSTMHLAKRNGYYDSKRIAPDELQIIFGHSDAELATMYKDKELDFVRYQPGEGVMDGADMYPSTTALLVNQSAPSMKSAALCQAMSLVIDRNTMVADLGGAYAAADGLVTYGILAEDGTSFREEGSPIIDNDPKHYEDNCALAKEKMAEAGYDNSAAIESLGKITLLYVDSLDNKQPVSDMKKAWKDKLGLDVTLNGVLPQDMAEALRKGEFTLALTDVTASYSDASAFLSQFSGKSAGNYGHFRDRAYNMLMRVAATSSNEEARIAYLKDAERLLLEKGGVIPLYSALCNHELRNGLTGLYSNGAGVYYFNSINEVTN